MKMKLKTKKIIKVSVISLMSALMVVGTCYFTDMKLHWVDKALDYFNMNEVKSPNDDVTIVNKGIRVKPVASVINSDGTTTKTFTYTIEPSDATIKDVIVTASYKDLSPCDSVLDFNVDQEKQQITVNCLDEFDQQIILKIKSKEWQNVSASISIDYEEKVKSITASSQTINYDNLVDTSSTYFELFTWNSSKYTIPKKDYTFTISGGSISNIDYSKLYYKLDGSGAESFINAFAALTKECLFKETIQNNYKNSQKVAITTQSHNPTGEQVWNLTNDKTIQKQLVRYWEDGMDQEVLDGSYITFDINDINAICSNGETYTFSVKVATSIIFDFTSCYTPVTNIGFDIPSIVF